eukprot:scaffold99263_cov39-Cyclotella_meneghiniana.AAC.1
MPTLVTSLLSQLLRSPSKPSIGFVTLLAGLLQCRFGRHRHCCGPVGWLVLPVLDKLNVLPPSRRPSRHPSRRPSPSPIDPIQYDPTLNPTLSISNAFLCFVSSSFSGTQGNVTHHSVISTTYTTADIESNPFSFMERYFLFYVLRYGFHNLHCCGDEHPDKFCVWVPIWEQFHAAID